MLLELRLKDFVLIEEARLTFEPGFIVLTGETGAGKTLLIKGLKLLMGARGSPSLIRPGASKAVLEAVFLPNETVREELIQAGLEVEEEILIRRILTPERSKTYLNDSPVSLNLLNKTISPLVVLAGQHDYQLLTNQEEKLNLLDAYAGITNLKKEYQKSYQEFRKLEKQLNSLQERIKQTLKEEDFLRFQLKEIEEISPKIGEDEELERQAKTLKNLSQLETYIKTTINELDKALSSLREAQKNITLASEINKEFETIEKRIENLYYETEDSFFELKEIKKSLPADTQNLEKIEERLYQLQRLKRKYGPTLTDVLEHFESVKRALEEIAYGEEEILQLEEEVKKAKEKAEELAHALHKKRKEAAQKLSRALKEYFSALALRGVHFEISFYETPLSFSGKDRIEFLVATQPGVPLRPLGQVVSGGELSRIFLALKTITAREGAGQVLVFDEVDVGVGGNVAAKIGQLLKGLSSRYQVICITHQPQIAALADQHFYIEKRLSRAKASTYIRKIEGEERVSEIARMLGGPEAQELAKRLLAA